MQKPLSCGKGAFCVVLAKRFPGLQRPGTVCGKRNLIPSRHTAFDIYVVLFCRRQKQQAVFGTAVRNQVGGRLLIYTWYRFADMKNSKLFLELRWLRVTSEQPSPLGWLARNVVVAAVRHPSHFRTSSLSIPTLRVGRADCSRSGCAIQPSPRTSKFLQSKRS